MHSSKNYLFLFCIVVGLWSCKKWDHHLAIKDQSLSVNLMEQINSSPELSTFRDYLVKTGLDKEISSSKDYTVWAPDNNALKSLDADIVNDTAKLKACLLNHISGQLFFTGTAGDTVRVPMLNGKKIFFYNKKFGDADITSADTYVRNGVLHIIDKVIAPLPNIWEYLVNTQNTYTQNAYVASLNYESQDPSKAELDSINPITGEPVYKPNTGIVQINTFRTKVYDIANEDSLYTYILLTNNAFSTETDKQKPYFQSTDAAITNSNASWSVVKDFAIKGMYLPEQLPAVLMSKFNVHVAMNKADIIETHNVSNGIVYVMSDAATAEEEKIPVCIVQGEQPEGFSSILDKYMTKVFYRQRKNSLTGESFNDIYLNLGSGGANFYVDYTTNNLFTTKYKVYWVALNDHTASGQGDDAYGTDSSLQQILKIGYDSLPYTPAFNVQEPVAPNEYSEVYLGEYTNTSYDFLLSYPLKMADGIDFSHNPATRRIRLQAPSTITSGIPYNLTLDYLRFVPVF